MVAVGDDPVPQCFITNTEADDATANILAFFFSGSHSSQCRSSERARQLSWESDWKVLDCLDGLNVLTGLSSKLVLTFPKIMEQQF